jgi:predicted neuraminidase
MESTPDMGITWKRTNALNNSDSLSAIQPTILVHPDGQLQILCRTKCDEIYSSLSTDNGLSWTKLEPTGLPNPNSGIDAVTMKDGRYLLVYNHIDVTLMHGKRNMLNVAISNDGINWEAAVLLENDPDKNSEYSYPAVIQGKDGLIHITYTWNRKLIRHVVLDPSKIKTKPMVNGN